MFRFPERRGWRTKRITHNDVREWPLPTNKSGNRIIRKRNLEFPLPEEPARRRSQRCNKKGRPIEVDEKNPPLERERAGGRRRSFSRRLSLGD